jgi:pSer/pThr/pTyr-binding forkhead associated (FHA) protein
VYGFGYAFGGEASGDEPRRPPSGFVHRLLFKDREIELVEGENVLGRDPDLAVAIRDASVSRRHARILVAGASVRVEDLKSKNGTFVGGERVVDGALLTDGDELRVGSVTLAFASQPVEGSTKTTAESG